MPDIFLNGDEYQNLYELSGIDIGTPVLIQNKSIYNSTLIKATNKPSKDFKGGFLIKPDSRYIVNISAGQTGLWMLGRGCIRISSDTDSSGGILDYSSIPFILS